MELVVGYISKKSGDAEAVFCTLEDLAKVVESIKSDVDSTFTVQEVDE